MKARRLAVMCVAAWSALCTLQPTAANAQQPAPPPCTVPRVAFLGARAQHEVVSGSALYIGRT